MERQHAAPAYRIYQGDTVLGVVWSNAVVNMDAWVRVTYDDGSSETLRMDRFVTGSARAAQLISTVQTAKHDGYVTEGLVFSDAPQRGQTYVVLYVSQGYNPGDVRMALCKGYVYASTPLAVGQQVEPGPAGGSGMIIRAFTDNPAAGVQHAVVAVPAGAIWKFLSYRELVAAYTAAAKSWEIRVTSNADLIGRSSNFTPAAAAGEVACYASAPNALDTVSNAIIFPVAETLIFAGDTISIVLNGIVAGDDLAVGVIGLQEWVMPN